MLIAKQIADFLTASRSLVALTLAWLGIRRGGSPLPIAVWLLLLAWVTDLFDGPIARRSELPRQTWVGDHDLEIDVLVSLGLLVFMVGIGLVNPLHAMLYILVWALVFLRWGWKRSPAMLFQAPIYGWFIFVAVRDAPAVGCWLVVWILALVVITWPRFPREVVPGFLAGMRDLDEEE